MIPFAHQPAPTAALLLGLVAAVPLSAQEAPALDPDAMALLDEAAAALDAAPRLGFRWHVAYETVADGREKITAFRDGATQIARPDRVRIMHGEAGLRQELRFDGATLSLIDSDRNLLATAPLDGTLETLASAARERFGMDLPLQEFLTPDLASRLPEGLTGAALLGPTEWKGQPVWHLAFTQYEADWQLFLSRSTPPLPVLLVTTRTHEQGWPQYRVEFSGWDFVRQVPAALFAPPDDPDLRIVPMLTPSTADGGGAQ
ncbi:DUF2092 domain-containing protein [Oceanomicrobium pacificus]|uniref:DUF2092 domain-containing protein n=1 Tax=Oceanomicrobium pacificus TaxID=2692916 RepID=A0A6B0TPJ1_9RHOB|nr:DUF2092 domain-containing protein [Oceanomicrobium pacificus]MXU66570.1 DUF2092 domain-containing protein [Oceanomicrobium pacificus]